MIRKAYKYDFVNMVQLDVHAILTQFAYWQYCVCNSKWVFFFENLIPKSNTGNASLFLDKTTLKMACSC